MGLGTWLRIQKIKKARYYRKYLMSDVRRRRTPAVAIYKAARPGPALGRQYVDQRIKPDNTTRLLGSKVVRMVPDGHCGFRAVALHQYSDATAFHQVREDLYTRLLNFQECYLQAVQIDVPEMDATRLLSSLPIPIDKRKTGVEVVRSDRWLSSTLHFQLLADRYNLIVITVADEGKAISIVAPTSFTEKYENSREASKVIRKEILGGQAKRLLCLRYTETVSEQPSGHFDYVKLNRKSVELRELVAEKGCFTPSAVKLKRIEIATVVE